MAKMIFAQKLKKAGANYIKVFSAGVSSSGGKEMTKESVVAIKKLGYRKERHKSTNVNSLNLNEFKIFALTNAHKAVLANNGVKSRSASDIIGFDIADPFHMPQAAYDECAVQIEKFCEAILKEILTVEIKK